MKNNFIENQNWRYATKKFDATKKIAPADLEFLKEAIRLSTSSYGLQLYKVFIIENPAIRAELQPASWGQSYLETIAHTRGISMEAVNGYGDFMKNSLVGLPQEKKAIWTSKQTYLALGNLLNAAAELKIDVTPMEGFLPEKYNEILGLNALGLNASLVAAVGYRHEDDATQHLAKVRKSTEELFETI